jgi:hypothetical protein
VQALLSPIRQAQHDWTHGTAQHNTAQHSIASGQCSTAFPITMACCQDHQRLATISPQLGAATRALIAIWQTTSRVPCLPRLPRPLLR